jgi:hypothetical protein
MPRPISPKLWVRSQVCVPTENRENAIKNAIFAFSANSLEPLARYVHNDY